MFAIPIVNVAAFLLHGEMDRNFVLCKSFFGGKTLSFQYGLQILGRYSL